MCADVSGPEDIMNMLETSAFFSEYIPGFKFGRTKPTNPTIEINTGSHDTVTIFESNDNAVINCRNEYSVKDIISLIELILEFYRQKHSIFTIHGAACDYKGAGILIIGGASGIGKSTLAYKLSEKTSNISFIGDEKICINSEGEIIGGIQKTSLNKKNDKGISDKELGLWRGSVSMVSIIIQPIICENGKLDVFEWDDARIKWHLYEEFSRKIRAVSRIVARTPIQSVDTDEIAMKRFNFVNSLSTDTYIKAFTVQGDIAVVANFIQRLIKGNSK